MSLPPGFLDEVRARTPLSQVVARRVSWDARRSNPAKGDFWACCPFHREKTPSFHVDDRKGVYHCFGCHASGDAVTFLREAEGMGFLEAVTELAQLGGLAMPAQDPAAAARAERTRGLAEWMEAAVGFFRRQLAGASAREARAYLDRRGLTEAARTRFEIGYAPPGRRTLTEALTAGGAAPTALVEAGLSIAPENGDAPFDRFRDRVMFPIRDARGRCIAFGGRALAPDAPAKYLNSPETPLFDKSRVLYNLGPAREAAAREGRLVLVEGYVDVITVAEAGLRAVVAPLGTAVTEHHLAAAWRLADEPVIALDGDEAGARAALRLVDIALPLLVPGKSLRLARLPDRRDPDDLVRTEGLAAFEAALAAAEPLDAALWRRETAGQVFDTPERRAALDARVRSALGAIRDPDVRAHYRAALSERRAALFRPAGPGRQAKRDGAAPRRSPVFDEPTPATRASRAARPLSPAQAARGREAAIVLALLNHPWLLERLGEELASVEFLNADLDAHRAALLGPGGDSAVDAALLPAAALAERVRETLASEPGLADAIHLRREADPDAAEACLLDILARHGAACAAAAEAEDAERALRDEAAPWVDRRLGEAVRAAHRDGPGRLPEADADEAGLAQSLRDAIDNEIWVKVRRPNRGNH